MYFCSIDWNFVVKLFPSVLTSSVAIFIFSQWKSQKGSEVIANEAKSLIINIAKLQSLQSDIFQTLHKTNGLKFPEDELTNFKRTKNDFDDSINFLGFALAHDKSLSQLPSIVGSQALLFIQDVEKYKVSKISDKNIHLIDPSDAFDLTQLLLGYAMYHKTVSKKLFRKKVAVRE